MAQSTSFHCQLITPEAAMLDKQVEFAAFTAHDGEVGLLPGRAPLLTKLGIGELRVRAEGSTVRFFIDGGFAQIIDDELTVLTSRAEAADTIDVSAVEAEMQALRDRDSQDAGARASTREELQRCAVRLRVAQKR